MASIKLSVLPLELGWLGMSLIVPFHNCIEQGIVGSEQKQVNTIIVRQWHWFNIVIFHQHNYCIRGSQRLVLLGINTGIPDTTIISSFPLIILYISSTPASYNNVLTIWIEAYISGHDPSHLAPKCYFTTVRANTNSRAIHEYPFAPSALSFNLSFRLISISSFNFILFSARITHCIGTQCHVNN